MMTWDSGEPVGYTTAFCSKRFCACAPSRYRVKSRYVGRTHEYRYLKSWEQVQKRLRYLTVDGREVDQIIIAQRPGASSCKWSEVWAVHLDHGLRGKRLRNLIEETYGLSLRKDAA